MANDEKLTPEEADVRNQAMLQDLRHMYVPIEEAQSLERMRKRLLATERNSDFNSMQTARQFMRKTKQGRIQSMHDMQVPITRKKGKYLNILVAGIVATLLIGSLLFAVTHVYQSNTGSGGPTKYTPGAGPKPTPVSTCDSGASVAQPTPLPPCIPVVQPTPTEVPIVQPTPTEVPIVQPTPTEVPIANPTPTVALSH